MTRLVLALLAAGLIATGAALPSVATAAERVDLALVLAVDVSASINQDRYDLQRHGLAAAFTNPAVIEAIQGGDNKAIVATLVEWSGPDNQKQMVGWTLVKDEASARAFGAAIAEAPRAFADFTSISGAIDFCAELARTSGYDSVRLVIDVSGDGTNNSGRPITEARDAAVAQGITINGLAILASEPNLDAYYRSNVIGGEGSFVIIARDFDAFAEAILNKLMREIAGMPAPHNVAAIGP